MSSLSTPEYSRNDANQITISNSNPSPSPSPRQPQSSLSGPVAILWDIENCPVPSDVRPEDVGGNIRMALRVHPVIEGAVTVFSAYGDFNAFPRRLREGCQRTGVKLVDVPNGRKDAADKAILVDMFLFALDHPPPSSIMLISGDVDFAPALHILGQRGYTVILVIPSGWGVSSALSSAGRLVWDWPSVARGEGFVPPAKANVPPAASTGISRFLMGEGQNEEESIIYRGISKTSYNTSEFSIVSRSMLMLQNPSTSRSCSDQCDLTWVQPGDLNGLKGQFLKLLESSGGSLPLTRLPSEYQKTYGRPLYMSEYGASKLVDLLKKMDDAISVEGKRKQRNVCIRKSEPPPVVILSRREKKGKGALEEEYMDRMAGRASSDEEEVEIIDEKLRQFKYEVQDILVSCSCCVDLGEFEKIYHQRYKREVDYVSYGVNHLEELIGKMRDVVVLQEEPTTRKKFILAAAAAGI